MAKQRRLTPQKPVVRYAGGIGRPRLLALPVRRPFTIDEIEALHPGQFGCYGLLQLERWIYVGKGDIRRGLLGHLYGNNPCVTRHQPTHWIGMVTKDIDGEADRLVRAHKPVCNQGDVL